MLPAIYAEILAVMIKGGRGPGRLAMASFTGGRKHGCLVIRVFCTVVVIGVTSKTGFGGRTVVDPIVTCRAIVGNGGMRPGNHKKFAVIGKRCRLPAGFSAVAAFTVGGKAGCLMIGTDGGIKIGQMTVHTFGGGTRVTVRVAFDTGFNFMAFF